MYCKGLFKRAIPFLLTFTIGILIASIFVPFTGSGFQFRKNRWKEEHREQHERMEFEMRQLREENERLREQLENLPKLEEQLPVIEPVEIKRDRRLKIVTVQGEVDRTVEVKEK